MTESSIAASSLPALTLALTPKTITVGGSMVSGAVNIVTTVTGEKSDGPLLILLKPGVTPAELDKGVGAIGPTSPLDVIDPYGSIVFDVLAIAADACSSLHAGAPRRDARALATRPLRYCGAR
jgi:hypothetical protein